MNLVFPTPSLAGNMSDTGKTDVPFLEGKILSFILKKSTHIVQPMHTEDQAPILRT